MIFIHPIKSKIQNPKYQLQKNLFVYIIYFKDWILGYWILGYNKSIFRHYLEETLFSRKACNESILRILLRLKLHSTDHVKYVAVTGAKAAYKLIPLYFR